MNIYRAIRLRALRAVTDPDLEYITRRTLRWYSKTFHTPLAVVEELPLDDVFQAYYEEQYAVMSADDLDAEREELMISDEERYQQILREEADQAEMFEMSRAIAAEEAAASKKKAQLKKAQKIAETQAPGPVLVRDLPESDLPEPKKTLPPIKMTFVDEAEFEREIEGFGAMAQPRKP